MKRLISALLPIEYREQVLGDLEERGFRPREVLGTVPRIWCASITRRFTAPVPNHTASEETILARIDELRRMRVRYATWLGLIAGTSFVFRYLNTASASVSATLAGLLSAVLIVLLRNGAGGSQSLPLRYTKRNLIDAYRRDLQITAVGPGAAIMPTMMLLNAFVDAMPGAYRGPLVAAWLCLLIPLFVLNLRRVGRLHREGLTL